LKDKKTSFISLHFASLKQTNKHDDYPPKTLTRSSLSFSILESRRRKDTNKKCIGFFVSCWSSAEQEEEKWRGEEYWIKYAKKQCVRRGGGDSHG
jgi:hypothetical protein